MSTDSIRNLLPSMGYSIRFAFGLLTVFPMGDWSDATDVEKRRSLYFFPLVGLTIGLLLWLIRHVLPGDPWIVAMIILTIWVVLTGGLHLDGLADSTDGLVGGHRDSSRILTIMRDPSSGPFAVVVLILSLAAKVISLGVLFASDQGAFLVMLPLISRLSIIILYGTTPYVRSGGIGEVLSPLAADRQWMIVSLASSVVVLIPFISVALLVALVAAALVFLAVRLAAMSRIQGFTGDVGGALIELTETISLLMIALVLTA